MSSSDLSSVSLEEGGGFGTAAVFVTLMRSESEREDREEDRDLEETEESSVGRRARFPTARFLPLVAPEEVTAFPPLDLPAGAFCCAKKTDIIILVPIS